MGKYVINLPKWGFVNPYDKLNERCPREIPDFFRAEDCWGLFVILLVFSYFCFSIMFVRINFLMYFNLDVNVVLKIKL